MADFSIKADVDKAMQQLRSVQEDQLPFIIAKSVTKMAQQAQDDTRVVARSVFQNRNDWTVRNIRITPATKQTLTAEVYTDTENRSTGAPDYLPKQQDSGDKVHMGGRQYFAVPTKYLWKYTPKNRPLPDNFRPKALLPPDAKPGVKYSGTFAPGGAHRNIMTRTMRKLRSSEYVAFLQHTKGGTLCIFVKHGGIRYHGGTQDAEPWFNLVTHAHISARFPMEKTVQKSVDDNFERIFLETAKEVGITISG